MKKIIVTTVVCSLVLAGYIVGQNQNKEKRIENCCCKHTQQIAEDLHWIRESMSKPFIPPPGFTNPGDFTDPGNPDNLPPIKVQKFNFTLDEPPNFRTPKKPTPKK
jgi:hypothetical protein